MLCIAGCFSMCGTLGGLSSHIWHLALLTIRIYCQIPIMLLLRGQSSAVVECLMRLNYRREALNIVRLSVPLDRNIGTRRQVQVFTLMTCTQDMGRIIIWLQIWLQEMVSCWRPSCILGSKETLFDFEHLCVLGTLMWTKLLSVLLLILEVLADAEFFLWSTERHILELIVHQVFVIPRLI